MQPFRLLHGDCREAMQVLSPNSVDSIITDPPYDLTAGKKGGSGTASVSLQTPYGRARIGTGNGPGGFMGMAWDATGVAFDPETWRHALAVLKPGGHLLAFGGTRTYHRMVCAIEDAGFEIRDQIGWVYGSGFPKSLDVSKAIDKAAGADAARQWQGWGTALKPAWEPIVVARKPLIGTVAENVLAHGTGALNIDGCRIVIGDTDSIYAKNPHTQNRGHEGGWCTGGGSGATYQLPVGRWPANIVHDGSDEVLAAFPLTSSIGHTPAARGKGGIGTSGHAGQVGIAERHHDAGSIARFFYCAKASKRDRGEGNDHPTVKPTALMRYLCRLVTPPGGLLLDPFAGSGSTGKAAMLEGFRFMGIEKHADYIDIARARILMALDDGLDSDGLDDGL